MNRPLFAGSGIAAIVLAGITVISVSQAEEQAGVLPYQDPARVAQGAEVYTAYCASCHGTNLEGEPNWKMQDENGFLPAPPHDETGHTWHHDDALLIRIVTVGTEAIVGGTYRSNMMGFGDLLSDREIQNVLA